jgi:hypothetical protein
MQDLQDLGSASLYHESIRHNAMSGKLFLSRHDLVTFTKVLDEIDVPCPLGCGHANTKERLRAGHRFEIRHAID